MDKKFSINGREKESYQLTNAELVALLKSSELSDNDQQYLQDKLLERFNWICCPHSKEENNDNIFARQLSEFINGKMQSRKETANLMAKDHRYLQELTFELFLEYAQILAENYKNSRFDARNEYACKCANIIISKLKEEKLV